MTSPNLFLVLEFAGGSGGSLGYCARMAELGILYALHYTISPMVTPGPLTGPSLRTSRTSPSHNRAVAQNRPCVLPAVRSSSHQSFSPLFPLLILPSGRNGEPQNTVELLYCKGSLNIDNIDQAFAISPNTLLNSGDNHSPGRQAASWRTASRVRF